MPKSSSAAVIDLAAEASTRQPRTPPWPPAIGVFYGSTDGNTANVAQQIERQLAQLLGAAAQAAPPVEVLDVADVYLDAMLDFDLILAGAPTWNSGQLQRDWEQALDEIDAFDLKGKVVAIFALGDQVGYPTTFADAAFFIADRLRRAGAALVGAWPLAGYTFESSWAVEDGQFLGLVLDEHTQPDLTEPRLRRWCAQVLAEYHELCHPS